MHNRYRMIISILYIVVDIVLLNLLYFTSLYAFGLNFGEIYHIIFVLMNLGYLLSFTAIPVNFEDLTQLSIVLIFKRNLVKLTMTILIMLSCMFFLKIGEPASRIFTLSFFLSACVLMSLNQWITRKALSYAIRQTFSKGVILGTGQLGQKVFDEMLNNIYNGVIILGFFDDKPAQEIIDISGSIEDAKGFIIKNGVTDVFCTLDMSEGEKIKDFIKFSESHILNFHIVPSIGFYHTGNAPYVTNIGKMPVFLLRHIPLSYIHNAMIKRTFDFVVSLIAIIVLFPLLFLVFGILIKMSSPGPILFKQQRTGKRGKDFTCYKFRTMKCNCYADSKQATINDDRKTKIGCFMRKNSIDELPQLFNVLIGNMSFVGPRPHMLLHTHEYSSCVDKYMVRHFIKPGITGLAQSKGYRGETKDLEQMEKRIMYDIEYVENWSLGYDLLIIFKTFLMMLKGDEKAH